MDFRYTASGGLQYSFYNQAQKNISTAENITDNIYLLNKIETPFVFGILSPGIYMPSSLSEDEMNYIILHEQTHIKRFDHIIKLLSFFILCIHWFNPLIWAAFFLSAKDMEPRKNIHHCF